MQDLYIGDYEYDDGQIKKDYPNQEVQPEYSVGARAGLAVFILMLAVALF